MKVTISSENREVQLGDLVVGDTGVFYLISESLNGRFTLYNLIKNCSILYDYESVHELLEKFFYGYTVYPKESLELLVVKGVI